MNLDQASQQIETLLTELRSSAGQEISSKAEDLVRTLLDLYGEALGRILQLVAEEKEGAPADRVDPIERLTKDRLIASLLVLHGLHPVDVDTRIQTALDSVRPYLGSHSGGVEYLGIDDEGVVRLRLEGSCSGCPSSTVTVKLAVERAIMDAAPEITRVEAEGIVEETSETRLLQIGMKQGATPEDPSWTQLTGLGSLLPGSVTRVSAGATSVLVCSVAGSLYAYRDACGRCEASLENGKLNEQILSCPECGASFDVHLAGRSVNGIDEDAHLQPLPLLPEQAGWKVAVPQAVGR